MTPTLRRLLTLATIVLSLAGLATSVALAIDHLRPAPAFCATDGCAVVRESPWSRPLGIPLPVLGIAFYAGALALLAATPRAGALRRAWLLGGGAIGAALIALQAIAIGTFCALCLVTDLGAIALAAIALVAAPVAPGRRGGALVGAVAIAAVIAPIALARPDAAPPPAARGPALPDVVARAQVAGELTIVEFIDFECPHCRALHARLTAALAEVNRPVRIVRKMVPLRGHPGALPAALAWCCADLQGKGDAMADALVAADPSELTPEGCERIAQAIGVDLAAYRRAIAAPETRARVDGDIAAARAAGIEYLPTVFIGTGAVFMGAGATQAELAQALITG